MITVNQEQLDTVEYLIQQSFLGNHVLFELDAVRRVFTLPLPPMGPLEIQEIEKHIEQIISLEGFEQKRCYVQALPEETLYRVIKTYFNIVENNLFETSRIRH